MAMMMRGGPQRFNKLTEIAKLGPAAIVQVAATGKDSRHLQRPVHGPQAQRRAADHRQAAPAGSRSPASRGGDMGGRGGASATTITREMANFLLEGTGQTIDDLKKKIETTMKPASTDLAGTPS